MKNKAIAMEAMRSLFVERDITALNRYWGNTYIQHNPNLADGLAGITEVWPYLPDDFTYEPGLVVEEGNIVMAHSRVTGWGPNPVIIVDIFRFENGRICEHWDVIQEETPANKTVSGNPMTSMPLIKYSGNKQPLIINI